MDPKTSKVCIVGAGSSGITAAKILHEHNIPFDCFEKGSGIGGNWRYLNDNGMSAAYRSLHINTSRDKMAYSDYPMPTHYPDFPHHTQIMDYFESYIDHFGFRDTITFQTEVLHIEPRVPEGGWAVKIRSHTGEEQIRQYRAVLVANGHHWCPHLPTFPGNFSGRTIHSHEYKTPEAYADKRVLVVGIGNSACDIACEISRIAQKTFLSTRRSAHVVPKYLLGRPLDAWNTSLASRLPFWMQRWMIRLLLFFTRGSQAAYGLPEPQHALGSEHPTISSDLLNLIGHGRITIKPNVQEFHQDQVQFVDGSQEKIDHIVFATGYQLSFPFFDRSLIDPKNNHLPLYLRVVPPDIPDLYFIGLLQPLGAIMPLAERQSRWVADLLQGKATLPPPHKMWNTIRNEEKAMHQRYVDSPRHTMQVDFFPYVRSLEKEHRHGQNRATSG